MFNINAVHFVSRALSENALDRVLTGAPGYCYLPPRSPSPEATDIVDVLQAYYWIAEHNPDLNLGTHLLQVLSDLSNRYDGLLAIASSMLFESGQRKRQQYSLGISLDQLAILARKGVARWDRELRRDTSGTGLGFPDGRLGDMRRRSAIIVDNGGPGFMD
jgi:hypothetical protein